MEHIRAMLNQPVVKTSKLSLISSDYRIYIWFHIVFGDVLMFLSKTREA